MQEDQEFVQLVPRVAWVVRGSWQDRGSGGRQE